ncbi:hypothetical protein MASR1M8_00530 [Thermomonas brevis]
MEIRTRIQQLQQEHGGLRAAARATGMSASYMIRLRDGEKLEPSARLLRKLGLEKKVTYARIK